MLKAFLNWNCTCSTGNTETNNPQPLPSKRLYTLVHWCPIQCAHNLLVAVAIFGLLCAVCVSALIARVGSAHQPPCIHTHTYTFTHMLSIPVWPPKKIQIGIRTWNWEEENHKMKIPDILCVCYTYALCVGRWCQRGERRKTLRRERRMFELRTLAVDVLTVCPKSAAANNCSHIYLCSCVCVCEALDKPKA